MSSELDKLYKLYDVYPIDIEEGDWAQESIDKCKFVRVYIEETCAMFCLTQLFDEIQNARRRNEQGSSSARITTSQPCAVSRKRTLGIMP